MKTAAHYLSVIVVLILVGCSSTRKVNRLDDNRSADIHSTVVIRNNVPFRKIDTKNIAASEVITFAETIIGTKYTYGSSDKEKGLDCSGFINYLFNHFKISVPRSSVDFTNVGIEVPIKDSKPGDLILFTGQNAKSGVVGHMGIITENTNGVLQFIHASESKGVMISGMNSYFIPRFVKVNRIFSTF